MAVGVDEEAEKGSVVRVELRARADDGRDEIVLAATGVPLPLALLRALLGRFMTGRAPVGLRECGSISSLSVGMAFLVTNSIDLRGAGVSVPGVAVASITSSDGRLYSPLTVRVRGLPLAARPGDNAE